MVFNSFEFLIFFSITYLIYLALQNNLKLQNRMLLLASCIFYGWWDWRFLGVMLFTIFVDYAISRKIDQSNDPAERKRLLLVSLISNLSILGFFKYFNFFIFNFKRVLTAFGLSVNFPVLNVLLPLGISFYVFQSLSYTIDVYRRNLRPPASIFDFALFVTFFPQLVAGPIERATHLLPQFLKSRQVKLDEFYEGCYLIFWGLFKKIFIADNLAKIAERVFDSPAPYQGFQVLIGVYAFAFQIYSDFSGYSDIARGLGKCMGFDIMVNFRLPYFSSNPQEFWSRWHISLSTWLKDYLYIPLGGNRQGKFFTYRNLLITMILGGVWHGAKWTFAFWGLYHGLLLVIHRMWRSAFPESSCDNRKVDGYKCIKIIVFFHLICFGWIFFRAHSLMQSAELIKSILALFSIIPLKEMICEIARLGFYLGVLLLVQFIQFAKNDLLAVFRARWWVRTAFYFVCFYLIIVYGALGGKEFIYFQF